MKTSNFNTSIRFFLLAIAFIHCMMGHAHTANTTNMGLTFYTNRTAFEAVVNNRVLENFENYNSSSNTTCASPVSHSNSNCFEINALVDGFAINSAPASGANLLATPAPIYNVPSTCVSTRLRSDEIQVSFPTPYVSAIAWDAYDYLNLSLGGSGSTFTVELLGELGNILGSTSFDMDDPVTFFGVSSDAPIAGLRFQGHNAFETIDNLTFAPATANNNSTITWTCPSNQTVTCAADIVPAALLDLMASTSCDDDIVSIDMDGPTVSGDENCNGSTHTYTYTAQDNCGNTETCLQIFTIANDPPTISCLDPMTVSCQPIIGHYLSLPSYTTSCGLSAEVGFSGPVVVGNPNCPGTTYTYTYEVTDDCGRSATCEQVFIIDHPAPSISGLQNMDVNCSADIVLTPQDVIYESPCNLPYEIVVTGPVVNGTFDCAGSTYAYNYIAIDQCGQRAIHQQVFTIIGQSLSTSCPSDRTISCNEDSSPANTGTASGFGGCGQSIDVTHSDQVSPGVCPQEMLIERTWTITDGCGEASVCTVQRIMVVDDEAPIAPTAPLGLTVQCVQDAPPAAVLTASDNCLGAISVLPQEQIVEQECSSRFTLIRTWTFDDGCNQSSISQSIDVIDTEPISILSTGDNLTVDCAHNAMPQPYLLDIYTPCGSSTDLEVQGPIVNGTPNCPGTEYIYTYIVKDDCGRSTSAQQTYVIENDGPEFICPPDICILDCDFSTAAIQAGFAKFAEVATVTSSCNGLAPTITHNFDPNGFIPQNCSSGPIAIDNTTAYQIVTFTATDPCNRSTTCTALVVMVDQTAPAIEGVVNNQIVECDDNVLLYYEQWIEANKNQLSASDACGTVNWSHTPLTPNMACNGVIAITPVQFIATDKCGNSSWVDAEFGIKNKFPATFTTTLTDKTIDCGEIPVFDVPAYVHTCGATEMTFEDIPTPGDCGGMSAMTRTWSVMDLCDGKTAHISQTIYFLGSAAAQFIQVPEDKNLACNEAIIFDEPVCIHSCENYELKSVDETIEDCAGTEYTTRTWSVIDDCGTSISCSQTIGTIDNEAPFFITFPEDVVNVCQESLDFGTPSVDDNCSSIDLSYEDEIEGSCSEGLIINRLWSAIDACGNVISQTQIIELLPTQTSENFLETTQTVFDESIHLFPNPASESINIEFRLAEQTIVKTTIYNLQGQIMNSIEKQSPKGTQQQMIDTDHYPSGTYVVLVQYHGKWLSQQFVKM